MSMTELAIVAVLLLAVFFAVRRIVKTRKSGGCSCGCAECGKDCAGRTAGKK